MSKILVLIVTILVLCSCSLVPKYHTPQIPLPKVDNVSDNRSGEYKDSKWWYSFEDKYLNELIDKALANNDDINLAIARVEEAYALYGISSSELYPDITASGVSGRNQLSKNYNETTKGPNNNLSFVGQVSYEIDLWGKLKNRKESNFEKLLSLQATRDTVKQTIISNVASTYINLIAIQNQCKLTEDISKKFYEIYLYKSKQFKHGVVDALEVEQAKAQYNYAKTLIDSLNQSKINIISGLSILIGNTPKELFETNFFTSQTFPKPLKIQPFISSKVLETRPDIIASEHLLKSANINIGVAKAAYFPTISLTGVFGFQSRELDNLIESPSQLWNIGGSLFQSVFDFGRRSGSIKVAEAQRREALIKYIQTVKIAFKEIFDSLNSINQITTKIKNQKDYILSLSRVLQLSEKQFEIGTVDYLTVLDAEEKLLNSKLNLIKFESELINYQILFYKSLGVGF